MDGRHGRGALVLGLAHVVACVVLVPVLAGCQAAIALPPDSAGPDAVLDTYLRTLVADDCDTGRHLATATFGAQNGDLCGSTHVTAYRIDPEPARPSVDEAVFSARLTTTGSDDGSGKAGEILWFYSLARQPTGSWRITGGGTGP